MSNININLVTVCTEKYPIFYAKKIHKRFSEVSKLSVKHFCITDRPFEVLGWATPMLPFKKSIGWWNKVNLYSDSMPKGYILYLDLDIVILKNFDDELNYMIRNDQPIYCVADAINWMGVKFSSSFMFLKSGELDYIFKAFERDENKINRLQGGDQVWTGPQLHNVSYINEIYPNLKKNLKFDLGKLNRVTNQFTFPKKIPSNIKLIDCGGRPKPHQLENLEYIKRNWHDVKI